MPSSEPYRSPDLPRGTFSEPGNLHVHVDGGGDVAIVERLLHRLERLGVKGKITKILDSVAGPQRLLLPDIYASHTPGTGGVEAFEYFSTISAGSRGQAIELLRHLLPEVLAHSGLVVEVERVIARVDPAGRLIRADLAPLERITREDVGIVASPTLAFEIHHAFDVRDGTKAPALSDLARDAERVGISTGGWFRFAKGDVVAYRSNAFSDGANLTAIVEAEHAALREHLAASGLDAGTRRTVVEEVLGIWHGV
jgi:hypothetical protein